MLIVVEGEGDRDAVVEAVERAGATAVLADDAAAGVALAEDESVEVVVADASLAAPDGTPIVARLRARATSGPIGVLAIADRWDGSTPRAFEHGADDAVARPLDEPEIEARIRRLLRMRASLAATVHREQVAHAALELTHALTTTRDFRATLFEVVRRIAELARVDRCSLVLAGEDDERAYILVSSDDAAFKSRTIDVERYPEIREAIASGRPLVIPDARTHPVFEVARGSLPPSAPASLTLVPLVFEDKPLGVLFLRSHEAISIDVATFALFRTIANALSLALHDARIVESLREATDRSREARAEAEARERSLAPYADFFTSAADGIIVIDAAGHVLFANPRASEITGYQRDDVLGRSILELLPAEELARAAAFRDAFAEGRYADGVDFKLKRRDGVDIVLNVSSSAVLRDAGSALISIRDVTAERRTAIELAATKHFLERVIDASVDAIVSADVHGAVLLFNRAAERCFGYRADEVVGRKNVLDLYPPGGAREVMGLIRAGVHGGPGRLEDHRCDMLAADGTRIPVSLSAALIHDDGKVVGSVGIFTDLRERLRLEQRLAAAQGEIAARERQSMIAELAGAAAHELNQPLTSVTGYAALLKRRLGADSPAFDAADVIHQEAERMAEIVRKIGKITRYETKSYVGGAKIIDLDKSSDDAPPASRPSTPPR